LGVLLRWCRMLLHGRHLLLDLLLLMLLQVLLLKPLCTFENSLEMLVLLLGRGLLLRLGLRLVLLLLLLLLLHHLTISIRR
jgi:hypothetical protein